VTNIEEAFTDATRRERASWEEVIFRVAKRAGIDLVKLSAGEVLTKMADEIIRLRKEVVYLLEREDK